MELVVLGGQKPKSKSKDLISCSRKKWRSIIRKDFTSRSPTLKPTLEKQWPCQTHLVWIVGEETRRVSGHTRNDQIHARLNTSRRKTEVARSNYLAAVKSCWVVGDTCPQLHGERWKRYVINPPFSINMFGVTASHSSACPHTLNFLRVSQEVGQISRGRTNSDVS